MTHKCRYPWRFCPYRRGDKCGFMCLINDCKYHVSGNKCLLYNCIYDIISWSSKCPYKTIYKADLLTEHLAGILRYDTSPENIARMMKAVKGFCKVYSDKIRMCHEYIIGEIIESIIARIPYEE